MNHVFVTLLCGLIISVGLTGLLLSSRPKTRPLDELLRTVEGTNDEAASGTRALNEAFDFVGYGDDRPQDLYLLGINEEDHAQRKIVTAILGGAWLFLMFAVMFAGGVGVPPWSALVAGSVGAIVGFIYPDLAVRSDAEDARVEFNYATAAFLGLARTLTTGGQEANAALGAAADAGSGPWFEHLQRACAQARIENREVAETLGELGERANIRVLEQVSGVLQTAYRAGTPPSDALATRTEMVLREQFYDMRMRAEERTEMMAVPTASISMCFIVYIGLPAFIGLMSGTSPAGGF